MPGKRATGKREDGKTGDNWAVPEKQTQKQKDNQEQEQNQSHSQSLVPEAANVVRQWEWRVESPASRAGQRDVLNVKCSLSNARCKCEVESKLWAKQIPRRAAGLKG
ncbi:hypothetical protein ACLKA6_003355 [Drosophila palustris]